jgi:trk system potassium uptake protein TrkA
MKALIVGCGRVGSALAKRLHAAGWEVVAVDETEEALERLGERWPGEFYVGHGLDSAVLEAAGIASADLVIVATDGDNTNLVIGQLAQKRFGIDATVVRVLDPARAALYRELGLNTVCPTSTAIETLTQAVNATAKDAAGAAT